MKTCPVCGAELEDSAAFCSTCGARLDAAAAPVLDPYDHTAEFESRDIADNKIYGILIYLTSLLGVIVALLAAPDSRYVRFHIRQCIKLTICEALVGLITALLFWTVIVGILGGIAVVVLAVVQIICLVNACKGLAKDAPIVRKIGFLN